MDTKRSQSLRKIAAPVASKLKMSKTQSQASVTPSQISEQNAGNSGDKNPLDALSRAATPHIIERRSGLQDIDEEYYKKLNFTMQNSQRYDHAAGQRAADPTMIRQQTGGATEQIQPAATQINVTQEQMLSKPTLAQQPMPAANNLTSLQQQQQQQQQEITQQQINYSPAAGEPEMCTTCPHCQTIIYLARSDVEMPMNYEASGGMHGQPDGKGVGKS